MIPSQSSHLIHNYKDFNLSLFQLRHVVSVEKDPLFFCCNNPEEISLSTKLNALCRSINKFQLQKFSTGVRFVQGRIFRGPICPGPTFLGGRFAEGRFGKGPICPVPHWRYVTIDLNAFTMQGFANMSVF